MRTRARYYNSPPRDSRPRPARTQLCHHVMRRRFERCEVQYDLLDRYLDGVQRRYRQAADDNARAWKYTLRLRLAVAEGVRNMFYEYLHHIAREIEEVIYIVRAARQDSDESFEGDSDDSE